MVGALVLASVAGCTVGAPTAPPGPVAAPARGFPAQPDGVPYPTTSWPRADWPHEADRSVVDRAVEVAFAEGAAKRVRSVAIVHKGRLIYERYSPNPNDGPEVSMPSHSVAKSVTSAAVGILVRQSKITVTAPANAPEWAAPGDPRHAITLDDLLRMSSGLRWSEEDDFDGWVPSRNAAKYTADMPLAHPPGTTFNYSTGSTFIVDRAMATALGGGRAFTEFIQTELFTKLGINLTLSYDAYGTWLGGYAADGSTLEYAKFGLLYLRDGIWEGQRILPEGWVEYSRTPSRTNQRYGSGWWLDPEARLHSPIAQGQSPDHQPAAFFALGARGQVIAVDPPHDLVYVITATDTDISQPVSRAIRTAFASA